MNTRQIKDKGFEVAPAAHAERCIFVTSPDIFWWFNPREAPTATEIHDALRMADFENGRFQVMLVAPASETEDLPFVFLTGAEVSKLQDIRTRQKNAEQVVSNCEKEYLRLVEKV